MILSGATTPGQSGPGSDGNEGELCIPQSSTLTGTSPSYFLLPYPDHSFGEGLTPLQRCSRCILHLQLTEQWYSENTKQKYENDEQHKVFDVL